MTNKFIIRVSVGGKVVKEVETPSRYPAKQQAKRLQAYYQDSHVEILTLDNGELDHG